MADTLRIAIAQLNPTVGDLDGNVAKALAMVEQAEAADADLVLLPEMTITGYPPEDLVFKPGFIGDVRASLEKFAAGTGIDAPRGKTPGMRLYTRKSGGTLIPSKPTFQEMER